jgi:predicted transposase YbfD/YdcC
VKRRLEASRRIVPHLDWPGLKQVCRLQRETRRDGKLVREVQYAITSLSPQQADAARLLSFWRGHWDIENRLHWIRDTHWREDRCRIRTGHGPQNMAAFRNAAINLFRLAGTPNLAAAIRQNAYRVDSLLATLGIMKL